MVHRACSILSALILSAHQLFGNQFHVTADAPAQGDGSRDHPWRLAVALLQPPAVLPGDTIWVHGGVYSGHFRSKLTGTPGRPVLLRCASGERAVLDGGNSGGESILLVDGSYAWYWGLEVISSDPNRRSLETGSWPNDLGRGECVTVNQDFTVTGCRFINLVLHDGRQGFSAWRPASDIEVYGCVMFNNGWTASDRPHGHNIYSQNETGVKRFAENILTHAFSHNIQVYGSASAPLDNFDFEGNVSFEGGERNVLIGGGRVARNLKFVGNFLSESGGGNVLNLGYNPYGKGLEGAVVTGNMVIGGELSFNNFVGSLFQDNVVSCISLVGGSAAEYPRNSWLGRTMRGVKVFVRANAYEPGRGNVIVYNGDQKKSVDVDPSSILKVGDKYVLLDAENYTGSPVLSGTYRGGKISLPMQARVAATPVGMTVPPKHSPPQFGAFVLLRRD